MIRRCSIPRVAAYALLGHALILSFSGVCYGEEPAGENGSRAEQIIRDWLASRRKIRQAELTVTENVKFLEDDGMSMSASRSVWFDLDSGRERLEVLHDSVHRKYRYFYNKEYCARMVDGSRLVAIHPPEHAKRFGVVMPSIFQIGLSSYHGFRGEPLSLDTMDELFADLPNATVSEVENGIKLQWPTVMLETKEPGGRCEYTFRTEGGLRPIRFDTWLINRDDGSYRPYTTTETEWIQRNDVWLPSKTTSTTLDLTTSQPVHAVFTFHWAVVNETISADQFEWEAMNVPFGTMISDHRSGKKWIIGRE